MPKAIHELPVEQIQGAFINHYKPPKAGASPCKSVELLDMLRKLPALYKEDHVDKEWLNISRLTEALIWSLQPNINADKRQEVINSLPGQLIKFCKKTSFNTEQMENSLADIETEYQGITAGEPGDSCDFELLDFDPSMADGNTDIDKEMLRQISGFDHHCWFLYDDKSESEEKVARLKLILNWQDSERLLFTNNNRRKVLHMTYSDMANYLEKGSVRGLNLDTRFFEAIGSHLMHVLQSVSRQNKAEKQAKERKALSSNYESKH